MKIRSLIIFAVLVTAIFGYGILSKAEVIDNSALIAQLQAQIQALMQQIAVLQGQQGTTIPWCHTFNQNLGFAQSGSTEVGDLKTALIKSGVWPYEAVTYEYDEETAAYVVKFQAKYGIMQSGYVGPKTRAKLNSVYGCGATQPPICTQDVKQCDDGSYVSRTGPNCEFAPCPTTNQTRCNSQGQCVIGGTGTACYASADCPPVQQPQCRLDSECPPINCFVAPCAVNKCVDGQCKAIFQSPITITSPNGGETFAQGESLNILWNSATPTQSVDVSVLDASGNTLQDFVQNGVRPSSSSAQSLGFSTSGSLASTRYISLGQYKAKVCASGTNNCDVSNSTFSIIPSVTNVSPYISQATPQPVSVGSQLTIYVANAGRQGNIILQTQDGLKSWSTGYATDITTLNGFAKYDGTKMTFTVPTTIGRGVNPGMWNEPTVSLTAGTYNLYVTSLDANNNFVKSNVFTITVGSRCVVDSDCPAICPTCSMGAYATCNAPCLMQRCVSGKCTSSQPSIQVTSPNGGETWKIGETKNITWTSSGLPSSALLSIGINGDGQTSTMAGGQIGQVPASAGSYSWTIPSFLGENLAGKKYQVYIIYPSTAGNVASDTSDNYFTISAASTGSCVGYMDNSVVLNSLQKSTGTVSFNLTNTTNSTQTISVSIGSGSVSQPTISVPNSACAAPNSITYTTPSDTTITFTYLGRVIASVSVSANATVQPSITLTSPNGGESISQGTPYNITWTSTGIDKINIELLDTATNRATIVASNVSASAKLYAWTPTTSITPGNYKITLVYYMSSNSGMSDSSNSPFAITAPSVACTDTDATSTNGGKDYGRYGYITVGSTKGEDHCSADGVYLYEYFCEPNTADNRGYDYVSYACPNKCANGACISSTTSSTASVITTASVSNALANLLLQVQNFLKGTK